MNLENVKDYFKGHLYALENKFNEIETTIKFKDEILSIETKSLNGGTTSLFAICVLAKALYGMINDVCSVEDADKILMYILAHTKDSIILKESKCVNSGKTEYDRILEILKEIIK